MTAAPLNERLSSALDVALRHREPATDEDVRRAVSDALSVSGHNFPLFYERLRRVEVRVPAIVRRLLDAEARVAELEQQTAPARARFEGRLRGLSEAAALVDNGDDCQCGGCDTCIPRHLAAQIRDRAALLKGAGS
jgi:hypothetical protein